MFKLFIIVLQVMAGFLFVVCFIYTRILRKKLKENHIELFKEILGSNNKSIWIMGDNMILSMMIGVVGTPKWMRTKYIKSIDASRLPETVRGDLKEIARAQHISLIAFIIMCSSLLTLPSDISHNSKAMNASIIRSIIKNVL